MANAVLNYAQAAELIKPSRYRLAYQPTHLFPWLWIKGMLSLTQPSHFDTVIFCNPVLINVTV